MVKCVQCSGSGYIYTGIELKEEKCPNCDGKGCYGKHEKKGDIK